MTPLLRQFVTVRLTDALQLDLDIFRVEGYQDLDLSWWGYFLSPGGRIYGVFGGRDEVSDKTRILSLPGYRSWASAPPAGPTRRTATLEYAP